MQELFQKLSTLTNLFREARMPKMAGPETPKSVPGESGETPKATPKQGRDVLETSLKGINQAEEDEVLRLAEDVDEAISHLNQTPQRIRDWESKLREKLSHPDILDKPAERLAKQRAVVLEAFADLGQQDALNQKLFQKIFPKLRDMDIPQQQFLSLKDKTNSLGTVLRGRTSAMLSSIDDWQNGLGHFNELKKGENGREIQDLVKTIAEMAQNGEIPLELFADFDLATLDGRAGKRVQAANDMAQSLPQESQTTLANLSIAMTPEALARAKIVKKPVAPQIATRRTRK